MKILIGYDGSDCAHAALDDLQRAGLPRTAEALLITVAELWLPPPPSSYEIPEGALPEGVLGGVIEAKRQAREAVEAANAMAFQASKAVQSLFPAWTVSSEAYSGSPAREILDRADEWGADLIFVGSHGRSPFGRLILGSVSQRVVTDASCSVRVARHLVRQKGSPARLIIGLDGSSEAECAVRSVASRNWPKESEVLLVTSVDPLHKYAMEPEDRFGFARSFHRAAETLLHAAGLQVASLIKEEDPKVLLVAEAERWDADSIFVGARGLGRMERFFLGSISTAVVSRAHCSVEVVRARS
ncbi:MAG TPA: universal stress protein [Blastocatellia bacterium]|nr:universal stress protein [Blastocatellia bacterium]